ncbi:MAG TPA: TIGR03013 family XrtA/PEP-CTERM system glycosyltransferase [Candidatus Eisenbacteria bacterium]|nr:TIGR03013 family XrtA/PEP-CTERM system glycosyltransferase [Candidatus Eisenbacteria bacterium]
MMIRIFKHYVPWNLAFLVVAESVIVFGSVYAGSIIKRLLGFQHEIVDVNYIYLKALFLTLATTITFYVVDLYDLRIHIRKGELFIKILTCLVILFFIIASINFIAPSLQLHSMDYLLSLIVFVPVISCFRLLYYWAINFSKEKVIILGMNDIARNIAQELDSGNNHGFEVQGLIAENFIGTDEVLDCGVLGGIQELARVVQDRKPSVVVVALSERRGMFPYKEILDCKLQGIRIEDWPTFYEKLTGKIIIQNLRPSWLIFADGFYRNRFIRSIKRITDVLLATVGLCIALPMIVLIAVLTKLDSYGPIFFRQERVGENGRIFTLYKFRTMVEDAEKETGPVWAQDTDPRTTRLGKILRRTGLDELPQMFNVLIGDMSFVGPRPERPHFVAELQEKIPYYSQRLVVKPGITGWAQVRYGYGATVEDAIEKLQFDLYYIKNMSFFLDMLIILSTAHKVLFAKVALQTNAKEDRRTASLQENSKMELPNLDSLIASWSSLHAYDKLRRPEAHRQESESSR